MGDEENPPAHVPAPTAAAKFPSVSPPAALRTDGDLASNWTM